MGRHKKIIDYDQVEKLANIFCTQKEIASVLNISRQTLSKDKKFLDIYKRGLDGARKSLRRYQFDLAKRSATMAIFLGKNYLGQRDFREIEIGATDDISDRLKQIAGAIGQSDTNTG